MRKKPAILTAAAALIGLAILAPAAAARTSSDSGAVTHFHKKHRSTAGQKAVPKVATRYGAKRKSESEIRPFYHLAKRGVVVVRRAR